MILPPFLFTTSSKTNYHPRRLGSHSDSLIRDNSIIKKLMNHAKADRHIMFKAIAREVNVKSVMLGKRNISSKKIKAIVKTFRKLRDHKTKTFNMLKEADGFQSWMQIVSHEGAYLELGPGSILPGNNERPDFVVESVISDERGFKALILSPQEIELYGEGYLVHPPMVLFQGTVPTNPHDIDDDLHENLGQPGMERNIDRIKIAMTECEKRLRRKNKDIEKVLFDVAGHSLGGNRAQRLTIEEKKRIRAVFTFQSPGVGDPVKVAKFREYVEEKKNKGGSAGYDYPYVLHTRTRGDIVTKVGGEHLPGFVSELERTDKKLSLSKVHSKLSLHKKRDRYTRSGSTTRHKQRFKRWERMRRTFSGLLKWLSRFNTENDQAIVFQRKMILERILGNKLQLTNSNQQD